MSFTLAASHDERFEKEVKGPRGQVLKLLRMMAADNLALA